MLGLVAIVLLVVALVIAAVAGRERSAARRPGYIERRPDGSSLRRWGTGR